MQKFLCLRVAPSPIQTVYLVGFINKSVYFLDNLLELGLSALTFDCYLNRESVIRYQFFVNYHNAFRNSWGTWAKWRCCGVLQIKLFCFSSPWFFWSVSLLRITI